MNACMVYSERFLLQSFNLLDVAPPPIPSVLLSLRKRTPDKNVGRILANEDEIVNVLQQGNMMKLNVEDMATKSFGAQLKVNIS